MHIADVYIFYAHAPSYSSLFHLMHRELHLFRGDRCWIHLFAFPKVNKQASREILTVCRVGNFGVKYLPKHPTSAVKFYQLNVLSINMYINYIKYNYIELITGRTAKSSITRLFHSEFRIGIDPCFTLVPFNTAFVADSGLLGTKWELSVRDHYHYSFNCL